MYSVGTTNPDTFVLKLKNYHPCGECDEKMKRLLSKIAGVSSVTLNTKRGKVTISGSVDPSRVMEKLERYCNIKAELVQLQQSPQLVNNNNQTKEIVLHTEQVQEFDDQNMVAQMHQFSEVKDLKHVEITYAKTVRVTFKGKKDRVSQESDIQKKIVMDDAADDYDQDYSRGHGRHHHKHGGASGSYDGGNWQPEPPPPAPNYYVPSAPPWPPAYGYPYYSSVEENPNSCCIL